MSRPVALAANMSRRAVLAGVAASAVSLALVPGARAGAPGAALRIGYQKNGSLVILRRQGTLEALFGPRGVAVSWIEFPAGPPLLEALNAGAVDFGATGDTPPIFAQAAGADLLYVGAQPSRNDSQAIIVRADGPVRTLADLKGRRVAYTRGSSAHNMVVQALGRAGLALADIQSVPLAPADATAAFRAGALDAWAIWDPFLAIAQQDASTRVLVGASDVAPSNSFFLARSTWATGAPDQVAAMLDAINAAAAWARAHPAELAALMTEVTGVPLAVQRVAALRGVYAVQPMDAAIIAQQQEVADTFFRLRIIPARIDVRRAVWSPPA